MGALRRGRCTRRKSVGSGNEEKRREKRAQGRWVNDGSEKKRNPARIARADRRSERASPSGVSTREEKSVHSLSDRRLKATLNEMNAFTCLWRLPSRIHSPFHFKCSAALFWVAALSPRPPRCTHHSSFCPLPPPLNQCLCAPPLPRLIGRDLSRARKFCGHRAAARSVTLSRAPIGNEAPL